MLFAVAFMLPGCSGARGGRWFHRPRSSEAWLNMALESEQPDDRREGVIGLADSSDGKTDWAIKVYDTIARTDTDAMVRCAALRALAGVPDADRVPTILKLLKSTSDRSEGVRAAPATVRWDAARLLLAIVRAQAHRDDQRREITDTLLGRVTQESDHNVCLTLIETLGYFQDDRVPAALIDLLENPDFAVQHAAETALVSLTGFTHHHDPDAWRSWLAGTHQPFALAGQTPKDLTDRRKKPRWDWLEWWE